MKHFDFIISGAGAAGLSLLKRMMNHPYFTTKQILVVDQSPKQQNDRTWCFWEEQNGIFESIVHHSWQHVYFHSSIYSSLLHLEPFRYKMIRGIDFYNYVIKEASQHSNITFLYNNVQAVGNEGDRAMIVINDEKYTADYIFNSILFSKPTIPEKKHYLLQHFKGKMIETQQPSFNPAEAVLMDFRISQQHGTTFMYVLPMSENRALVEYTLFTKQLLDKEAYDIALEDYIKQYLNISEYTVVEEEFGIIPMTNIKFPKTIGRVMNIGTAGGQTKASSGYTFQFIQKQSDTIIESLVKNGSPKVNEDILKKRFQFYDSTLLNILSHNKLAGDKIFTDLFSKNIPARVLRFLDNNSTLEDEINIMSTLPSGVFMKAALQEIFR